jgi:hypothetical protein
LLLFQSDFLGPSAVSLPIFAMAAMRGERFNIDLDADDQPQPEPAFKTPCVGDVVERTPARPAPPSAPSMTVPQSSTGWPVVESRYRPSPATLRQTEASPPSMDDFQMREIDAENKRRIAEMSLDDIEEQRSQIFASLNPSLIDKLLKRSADDSQPKRASTFADDEPISKLSRHSSQRSVSFALPSSAMDSPHSAESHSLHRTDSDASTASSLLRKLSKEDRRVSFAESDASVDDKSTAERHSLPGTPQIPPSDLPQPPSPRHLSHSSRTVSFSLPDTDGDVEPSAAHHGLPPTPSGSEGNDERRIQPLGRRVSFAETETEEPEPISRTTAAHHSLPPTPPMPATRPAGKSPPRRSSTLDRKVSFAEPEAPSLQRRDTASSHSIPVPNAPAVHFPKPPMPTLDPNSPAFLDDLHATFFPNLAHDPSKLDWMRPRSAAASSSSRITPDTARFDFNGALLPPDAAVPDTQGLHHHGDAPDAPGYTLAELARLARSALPAQRCVALQTLGRVLYRLGRGDFSGPSAPAAPSGGNPAGGGGGGGGDGKGGGFQRGLWARVREERIADTLLEEARRERGHRTAIALAREAVWNWRRGVEEGGGEDGLAGMPELPEELLKEEQGAS